jgi:hypothetical protein
MSEARGLSNFKYGLDDHIPKQEFKRSLFIGLGGSGVKIITRLKRYFIEQYGKVPETKVFLGIDTDNDLPVLDSVSDNRGVRLDPYSEFYYLKVRSPLTVTQNSQVIQEWLIEPYPVAAILAGTGAVRQAGRLALFAHAHDAFGQIRRSFEKLERVTLPRIVEDQQFEVSSDEIEVYICGSVAGGTGSGTFIDVGIFCRNELPPETLIYGVFLGPWIYRDFGATFRCPGNAYASLMELDTVMGIGQRRTKYGDDGEEYRVQYDRGQIIVDKPPFNIVHLVDGRNQQGKIITNLQELIKFVAEGIFLSTSANIGGVLRSAVDNILTITTASDPEMWDGKLAYYSSFGASAAVFPARQYERRGRFRIAERILTEMKRGLDTEAQGATPGAAEGDDIEDLEAFLSNNPLDPEKNPTVLNGFLPKSELPTVKINPPTNPAMLNDQFPKNTESSATKKYQAAIAAADNILNKNARKRSEALLSALESYIKYGAADELKKTTGTKRATRIRELQLHIKKVKSSCNATIQALVAKANNSNTQLNALILTIQNIIDKRSIFTPSARVLANVSPNVMAYKTELDEKLTSEISSKILQKYSEILNQMDIRIRDELKSMAEVDQNLGSLAGFIDSALHEISQARMNVEQESLRSDLSDFEELVELVDEPLPNEETVAAESASKLVSTLEANTNAILDTVLEEAGAHAAEYYPNLKLLDVIDGNEKKTQAMHKDDPDKSYIVSLLSRLEHLGQPLWNYDPGLITEAKPNRRELMTSVVILGAEHRERASQMFEKFTFANNAAPNVVGTGDPHRASLIVFAASLPIYALREVDYYQERYSQVLTPPLHSSKFFEANSDWLIPARQDHSLAFKLLSVGIIKGIDIISDDHAKKGSPGRYRMLAELEQDPEYKITNLRPKLGDKFIEALGYLSRYRFVREQVLKRLVERLDAMTVDEVAEAMDKQIAWLSNEVEARKMNKILTWRYMNREIELLVRLKGWKRESRPFEDFFLG